MSLTEQLIEAIDYEDDAKMTSLLRRMTSQQINEKDEDGHTSLHYAARCKNATALAALLKTPNIQVNIKNRNGQTPLHYAASLRKDTSAAVLELLQAPDIMVNVRDNDGITPLHWACYRNYTTIVEALLKAPGIMVNFKDNHGNSPIMDAAEHCHRESLELMLADGRVELGLVNNHGKGLEYLVGRINGNEDEKKDIKRIIRIERERRERRKELANADQEAFDNELEEFRNTQRNDYARKIKEVSRKLMAKEKRLRREEEIGEGEKSILRGKHHLEKKSQEEKYELEMNMLEERRIELERRLSDVQQRKRRDNEDMNKRHREEMHYLDARLEQFVEKKQNAVSNMKKMLNELNRDMDKWEKKNDAKDAIDVGAARETLECPVCTNMMKPPTRIWMCSSSHIICETCKNMLDDNLCPTCRTSPVSLRSFLAENFAECVFNK